MGSTRVALVYSQHTEITRVGPGLVPKCLGHVTGVSSLFPLVVSVSPHVSHALPCDLLTRPNIFARGE